MVRQYYSLYLGSHALSRGGVALIPMEIPMVVIIVSILDEKAGWDFYIEFYFLTEPYHWL